MDSREFAEWMAYENIEPSEPQRGDLRTALICSVFTNLVRGLVGEKGKGPELKDFLLQFEPAVLEPVPYEKLEVKMKSWLHQMKNQQDKRKVKDGKYRKHSGNLKSE